MKFVPNATLQLQPCTHTIYRPFGGVEGYRQISDPAGRLAVTAFPMQMAGRLSASFDQWSACYLLAGNGQAYIGQTICAMKCIAGHAVDPAKAFASEVFLLHAQEPHTMDWSTRIYMEHRLTELAKEARLVSLANALEPRVLSWGLEHVATLELFLAQARRLLFDAGCRLFNCNFSGEPTVHAGIDDSDKMKEAVEIASPILPILEEFEFDYCGIWARGAADREGFTVKMGSELRATETPSLRQNIKRLRADLLARGVVVPIAGVRDRLRLQVDWRFFSPAVAAKCLAGAHVAGTKWVPLRNSPSIRCAT